MPNGVEIIVLSGLRVIVFSHVRTTSLSRTRAFRLFDCFKGKNL